MQSILMTQNVCVMFQGLLVNCDRDVDSVDGLFPGFSPHSRVCSGSQCSSSV